MKKRNTTIPAASKLHLLRQIGNLIPEFLVPRLARETGAQDKARTFKPWSHALALMYAHLRLDLHSFLARKHDGMPGWQTIWRGWQRLMWMCEGVNLMGGQKKMWVMTRALSPCDRRAAREPPRVVAKRWARREAATGSAPTRL